MKKQHKRCKQCSKEYKKNTSFSNIQWDKSKFCSLDCLWKSKKNQKLSKEQIKKLVESHKGKKLSPEHIAKLKGRLPWNKGRVGIFRHSLETKKRISKKLSGEKSHLWKGGISKDVNHTRARNNKRHALKRASNLRGDFHTDGEWDIVKKQYNFTCPACKKQEPNIKLTKDHIIPLTKGGSDNIENIQPLCKNCNSHKYTKTIKYGYSCN